MILKNVKIRNYSRYKNLFTNPYNMAPVARFSLAWPSPYWGNGVNGVVYAGPDSLFPPGYEGSGLGIPVALAGSGAGDDVFVSQAFPYSRLTTYKVSVWMRYRSGTLAGVPINAVIGGCGERSTINYPVGFNNAPDWNWYKIEHTFKTTSLVKSLGCYYKNIFFGDGMVSGLTISMWGAELNVIEPGPDFFEDWPQLSTENLVE